MFRIKFITVLLLCALTSCKFFRTDIEEKEPFLFRIQVEDKYGFMDEHGKIVLEPQFDDANECFSEGVCFVKVGNKRGLINSSGVFILEFPDTVEYVSNFKKGFATIRFFNRDRFNCNKISDKALSIHGNLIMPKTPPILAEIYCSPDDRKSWYLVEPELIRIDEDEDNLYFIWQNGYFFVTDTNGNPIGDESMYTTESNLITECNLSNGMFTIRSNKWGYMDLTGQIAIDFLYDYAWDFSEDGIALVKKDNELMFIDKSGYRVFSIDSSLNKSPWESQISCNRAAVIMNGEKCLVDKTGKKICNLDVDEIYPFDKEDRLATIKKGGKAAKIDTMGNIVLATNYTYIGSFIDGIAPVYFANSTKGFIDLFGNEIIPPRTYKYSDEDFHYKNSPIRAIGDSYYDLQGNLLWSDIPSKHTFKRKNLYQCTSREDYIEYFDSRLSKLDPIEGIYYVTTKYYYQDRDNPNIIGLNNTESDFRAIVKDPYIEGFAARIINKDMQWANKFVRIGESNTYAIMKIDKDDDYSSEDQVSIEDFTHFGFKLDLRHNNYYNFFATFEFVRDYPTVSEIERVQRTEWTGSGFAIANGYIATNYHVTDGAKSIRIKGVDGNMQKAYKGYVVASDKENDISILKIVDKDFNGFGEIPYSIGKATVEAGDEIFVLGYPLTSTMGEEIKLTQGIISATSGYKGDPSLYQISAAVQPGNSGGPLFNEDGAVIGIICGTHSDAENANYAVKVSYLYNLVSTSSHGININQSNHIKGKKLSTKVKKVKNHVYLIECSSK